MFDNTLGLNATPIHRWSLMKYLFLILSICFFQTVFAQNKELDNLNSLLIKTNNDTARINIMNKISRELQNINLDSAIAFSIKTVSIAKAKHYVQGEAEAHRYMAGALSFKSKFAEAKEQVLLAMQLYQSASDSIGIGKTYGTYGLYYGVQSKYDSSNLYIEKSIPYIEAVPDKSFIGTAYQNIAVNYQMQSKYLQALEYQKKALDIANAMHDESSLAYINLNVALVYNELNDGERGKSYLQNAVQHARNAGIMNVEQYAYANLASLYGGEKNYDKSYSYAMKAYELGKTTGDQGISASSLSRAAVALANQNKFEEAEQLNKKAILLADSAGVPLNRYQTLSNQGFIKKHQKQFAEAIPFFEKAFTILNEADMYDGEVASNYSDLSDCYEATGNYQKALSAFKTAAKISDSLLNRDNVRKATELTMNNEFERKQQAQQAKQAKEDAANKVKLISLIAVLVVLAVLFIVSIIGYRREQKAKKILRSQKGEIESTLTELKMTQAQLIQSEKMASLGELTAGIAHEIQNPLNFVNNFSELNSEMIEELKEELNHNNIEDAIAIANDIKSNEQKIVHHGKRADAIVKGMLQHSRKTTGQKELTNINALCDEYLRLAYHGLRAKDNAFKADFTTDFDNSIGNIHIVPQDIGRVLLNLFNNAFYAVKKLNLIKGNEYKPLVSVVTKRIENAVEIVVSDNGNGIPATVIDKIFQPFFTTKPTGEGTGLGLSLSYDIITKEHNGTIKAESEEGKGSRFIITLPL